MYKSALCYTLDTTTQGVDMLWMVDYSQSKEEKDLGVIVNTTMNIG